MNDLNLIMLDGNLVRDPQLSVTQQNVSVCSFTIATNRYHKEGNEYVNDVSYFDVTCWEKLAIACGDVLKKGRGVRVTGELRQNRWQGQDGSINSRIQIIASKIEFKPVRKKDAEETVDDNESEAVSEQSTSVSL